MIEGNMCAMVKHGLFSMKGNVDESINTHWSRIPLAFMGCMTVNHTAYFARNTYYRTKSDNNLSGFWYNDCT